MSKTREESAGCRTRQLREPLTPDARLMMRFCCHLPPEERAFIRQAMKARMG
jgi:hypothetical protein